MPKKESEKQVIIDSPKRRPYGARLALLLEKHIKFNFKGECTLLLSPDIIVRLVPRKKSEGDQDKEEWLVLVEGFATAGEAEQYGLKIALGLLWSAISNQYGMRLIYQTPLPCSVYDRMQQKGLHLSGDAHFSLSMGANRIVEHLNSVIPSPLSMDPKLLVASELFAAGRLETTERARFIGLVSSLEPLAVQEKYEIKELNDLIITFKELLQKSSIDDSIKTSLINQIQQLKRESVLRAIKRLVQETIPDDPIAIDVIKEAYSLRSKIIHEGSTDADLELKSKEVEKYVYLILETRIKQYLKLI